MIPAAKHPALERLFAAFNRWMLRRHFAAIHVGGADAVHGVDRTHPIVLAANHSNWWDGLLAFYFSHDLFTFDAYAMMEERQLVRYPFFRRIGAFSVRRESARDGVRALRYAASLFPHRGRAVWIYPQGAMGPNDLRPLSFYTGAARLIQMLGGATVIPLAHRYEFLSDQRPEVFTLFGAPQHVLAPVDAKLLTTQLEKAVTDLLDAIQRSIVTGNRDQFRTTLHGHTATNIAWDRIRGKAVQ